MCPHMAQDVCRIHARLRTQPATHTCLSHTHPDVVGVDVVGSRHAVVHVMQGDTGGINWEGEDTARVSGGGGGLDPPASLPADRMVSRRREEGALNVQEGKSHTGGGK